MLRTSCARLAALATAAALCFLPGTLSAQQALVYCPVGIDATGCTAIVAALAADATRFPGGAEAGYDGTQGTVDLATADFSAYTVFVVPSLADGPDAQPYALLRDGTIAARLNAAFTGRAAVWSGTPDVGSTNRSAKDGLIRNLAAWASADGAGTRGPGVVALQDNSDDEAGRYGWLGGISPLSVTADPTLELYSNVQVLTSTGQGILTNDSGLQVGYTNMASYGLVAGQGGSSDATGGRTSRVVLVTAAGASGDALLATVHTDREDYAPGDTVIITGTGWEPGETVALRLHEDPVMHEDRTISAVADVAGNIYDDSFSPEAHDNGVRFVLTATGQTSGRTAQTTFTDAVNFKGITVGAQTPTPVAPGGSAAYVVTVEFNGSNTTGCSVLLSISGLPTGAAGSFSTNPVTSAGANQTTTLTITTNASTTPPGTTTFTVQGVGTACTGTQTGDGTLAVRVATTTAVTSSLNPSLVGQSVTLTASVTRTSGGSVVTTGSVTFIEGGTCAAPTITRQAVTAVNGSGQVTFTTSTLAQGSHTIVGCYDGTTTFGASSGSVTQVVNGAPDLTINKSHTGNFVVGTPATYTLTVTNSGTASTSGTVTVTDVQPAGLSFTGATGTGWVCGGTTTISCSRSNALVAGTNYPDVTVNVTPTAAGAVTNTASVAGGGEVNTANDSDSDPTTVVAAIDLTINKSHAGNFTLGVNGTYTLAVANGGGTATNANVTVTDVLPTGLGFVSGSGTGWNACTAIGQTVTCIRLAVNTIAAGGSAPNISLVVTVAEAAFASVTNTASVSGGGEPAANNGNNSDSDPTTVVAPDLAIDKSHAGSFIVGVNGTYTFTVSNGGGAASSGTVTVTDVLPTGLGFVSGGGGGWTCTGTTTITCTRGNVISAGGSAPSFTIVVSVGAAAAPSATNTASVGGGGEPAANNGNNSDSDLTTVATNVDLAIDKSHTGNFTEGVNGSYSLAVSNGGGTATSANVTVTDVLPTGLGFVSGTGTGWSPCTALAQTVTCIRLAANTIAAGGNAPAITLTVSVAAAAVPGVTNTASVSGGGEPAANANNSDSDPTTVIASNRPPVVDAGGPYTGNEGSAISLNTATATDPDAGDTPTYKWTYAANGAVDAGTTCGFSNDAIVQPTFTCNDDGAFTVTLTVNDGHAHIVSDDAGVTVANVKPTATAGGPYSGNEGSAIQLGGSGDDPAANDDDPRLTYQWTVNTAGIDAGGACTFDDATKKDAQVTCTDDGAFTVTLVATDDDGAPSTGSPANLTVANLKPVATAAGPYSGDEGSAIPLGGSGDDPGNNDDDPKLTYLWTVNTAGIDAGGTCTFDDATKKNAAVTCTDDSKGGTFTLTLVATDDDGASSTGSDATLTVANVAPVAEAGGPYSGNEGAAVQLNGSATDVGTHDTFTWKWLYEAGADVDVGASCSFSDIHAQDPTVTCTDDGTVKLTLTVKDDNTGESQDEATLTLANVKPVATAGGPYSGNEGAGIPLHGSADDPGDNDDPYLTYQWSANVTGIDAGGSCTFDDATNKDATVTCTDDSNGGTFKLSLVAKDDDGGTSLVSYADLTVANLKPVASAGGPYTGDEGSAIPLDGSADDPGDNDDPHLTYLWTVNTTGIDAGGACTFNDASKKNATINCTDDGAFTLTLVATDDEGASSIGSTATLTVANANPIANAGGPYPGNEGAAIQLNGSADDPGNNDDPHLTYLWTVNTAGIDVGGTCTFDVATKKDAKVTCTDDGSFTLTLTAYDDDGGSGSSNATLTVQNVKPTMALTQPDGSPLPATIVVAGTLNIKVPYSDPASNDTHKAQIDCGSGAGYVNVNGGTDVTPGFQTSCTFATIGVKTIKVKVTDDDGAYDEKTHVLTVRYNFIGFSAPVDRPNTMNISKAGQAIPLKWQLLDANGVPVTNLTAVDIKISSLSCGGNVPTDLIEEYASGASGLNNKGGGNYQFNWKTPTNYLGTCKNIGLDFGSGYVEMALAVFNFKS